MTLVKQELCTVTSKIGSWQLIVSVNFTDAFCETVINRNINKYNNES